MLKQRWGRSKTQTMKMKRAYPDEGINQKIKTLRRHAYGYPDDEYFFLKLFDMSRQGYVRNTPSHRFSD